MKCTAIVLAAGQGKRMKSDVPKQFLKIQGYPVVYYSLQCFQNCSWMDEIILVTGEEEIAYCREHIVDAYGFTKVSRIVSGGRERYHSVYQGLLACRNTDYVFIHDGARPFITEELLERGLKCVREKGACVAGMPSKDTVKIVDASGQVIDTPDRKDVWNVQTPQIFSYGLIYAAYTKMMHNDGSGITDDAMVLERYGDHPVYMYEGSYQNIKITTPEDLAVAEDFLHKI